MNIENNAHFKKLFDSIKTRIEGKEGDKRQLAEDVHEAIENMITAIEYGRGDSAFAGMFLPRMNRYFDYNVSYPAAISCENGVVSIIFNPLLIFMICDDYKDFSDVVTHEIYHLVFKHLIKQRDYPNNDRTNIAMDTSINQYINFSDNMSKHAYTIENFCKKFGIDKNKIELKREFEYYYEMIPSDYDRTDDLLKQMLQQLSDLQNQLDKMTGGGGSSNQSSNANQNQQGNSGGSDSNSEENESDSNNQEENSNNSSGNSSIEDLEKQIADLKKKILDYISKNYVLGDISENQKGTANSITDQLAMNNLLEDAINAAKQRGAIPSSMEGMINNLYFKAPIISWKKELRNILGSIPCPYRKTMRVKNRRQPKRSDILGRVNDRKIKIAIAIDTSGSVSDTELKYFFNEFYNIVKDMETDVMLIQCDAEVSSVDKVTKKQDVSKVKIKGRGGTWFSPVFKYLKENVKKVDQPNVIIYFTDGGGENNIDIEYLPNAKIMWVLTTNHINDLSVQTPEYIKTVRLLNIAGRRYEE